jgi:YVTN family beta-propeller protein
MNIQASTDIAFNSTGTMAYVTSDLSDPGQVYVVDTATYRVLSTYTVGNGPSDISMSYGDQFLVVNNDFDGTVSVIDLRQDKVTTTAQLGASVTGIAFVQ